MQYKSRQGSAKRQLPGEASHRHRRHRAFDVHGIGAERALIHMMSAVFLSQDRKEVKKSSVHLIPLVQIFIFKTNPVRAWPGESQVQSH